MIDKKSQFAYLIFVKVLEKSGWLLERSYQRTSLALEHLLHCLDSKETGGDQLAWLGRTVPYSTGKFRSGRTSGCDLVQSSPVKVTHSKLLRDLMSWILNICKDGNSTTSLGNQLQCQDLHLHTTVKNVFPFTGWNFPCSTSCF